MEFILPVTQIHLMNQIKEWKNLKGNTIKDNIYTKDPTKMIWPIQLKDGTEVQEMSSMDQCKDLGNKKRDSRTSMKKEKAVTMVAENS